MTRVLAALALAASLLLSCGEGPPHSSIQCDATPSEVAISEDLPRLGPASGRPAPAERYVIYFSGAAAEDAAAEDAAPDGRTGRTAQALRARDDSLAFVADATERTTRAGGEVVRPLPESRAVAALLDYPSLARVKTDPGVRRVERDPKRFLKAQSVPWGIAQIAAPEAWSQASAPSRGARVCVIDSGLYPAHEDLQATASASGHPDSWNQDRCGHGTHVAGTIAAQDNALGVVGASPQGADLFAVKVFGDDCSWSYASELADAVTRCADAGARVVNLSLGGYEPSEAERDAVAAAWRRGLLLVAAAGNEADSGLEYPASYPPVISVGAVDSDRAIAPFSQHNPQVDLVAPGVGIASTVPFIARHLLTVDGSSFEGTPLHHAADTPATGVEGPLADGGTCSGKGDFAGRIVLCRRGGETFAQKVRRAQESGALAAVIYNAGGGTFVGTLGEDGPTLPAFAVSGEDGQTLLGLVGDPAKLISLARLEGSGYAVFSGTSMSAPHVSGVAAFLLGQHPEATNAQVRAALEGTAVELGPPGVDDQSGHGLVQADAALRALEQPELLPAAVRPGFLSFCEGLRCTFSDASLDDVGVIARRRFELDDGTKSSEARFEHTFASPGVHPVTLTATNAKGQRAQVKVPVSVVSLSAGVGRPEADGGFEVALRWLGAGTATVTVVRNDELLGPAKNTGAAVDHLEPGAGPLRYRVCSAGAESCSNEVTVLPPCGQP